MLEPRFYRGGGSSKLLVLSQPLFSIPSQLVALPRGGGDAGKKVKGRKRSLVVDTLGLLFDFVYTLLECNKIVTIKLDDLRS